MTNNEFSRTYSTYQQSNFSRKTYYSCCNLLSKSHTLPELIQSWLASLTDAVQETTLAQYQSCLERYVKPYFGNILITDVTEDTVQSFYNQLGYIGKNLSPHTIHLIKTALHQVLEYGVALHLLSYNPSDLAYIMRRTYNRKEILTEEIIHHILNKGYHNTYENFFPLLLITTMRYGECAGLSWDAVNFQEKTLNIRQHLVEYYAHGQTVRVLKPYTKNHKIRTLLLPDLAIKYLYDQQELQRQFKKKSPLTWSNSANLVFTNRDSSILQHSKVRRRFKKLTSFYGMPEASIHTLRHTGCSILYAATKDISLLREYTGHSSDGAASYYIHSQLMPEGVPYL